MDMRTRACAALALVTLAGCGGDEEVRTVTVGDREARERVSAFALAETKRQARKTCTVVPRNVLADSFGRVSGDRESLKGRRLTDNDIALLYAEDIGINPIPLQRAAYDGCLEGLRRAR